HRIKYSEQEWKSLFERRGIFPSSVSKINQRTTLNDLGSRGDDIEEWVNSIGRSEIFVIIDDDSSVRGLPETILSKCVLTESFKGLNDEAMEKALEVLLQNNESERKAH